MVKSKSAARQLAQYLGISFSGRDVELSGISSIANEVEPGDLFVALPGAKFHGLDFLDEALSRGAAAVLSDQDVQGTTSLLSAHPRELLGEACNLILGHTSFPLFAVTGTNGKTSTTNYLYQLLSNLGVRAGMAGSTGLELPSGHRSSALTSIELTSLRKYLRDLTAEGGQACAIEVSAHALVRSRVSGLTFDVAGFTNLSRDHLDDFGDMDSYFAAKASLFTPSLAKQAAVFISDPWSEQLASKALIPTLRVGPGQAVDFEYLDGRLNLTGELTVSVVFPYGELMARNLALAITMLHLHGYSDFDLAMAAEELTQVPGRLQLVSEAKPSVYVDYAHTPDGIHSAISEILRTHPGVTVLVSASGDRDQGKRFEMGQAAAIADQVIVTDQHPRSEDPAEIRRAVAEGLSSAGKTFTEIADPAEAIEFAVSVTPREHAVLWCGPGNLKYREIAGTKQPFDAIAIAKLVVENS
jgi:UDP-N-acetylmuramoyl-L-alanyl-D-glutamate--2,6-diaminopimelate ligase